MICQNVASEWVNGCFKVSVFYLDVIDAWNLEIEELPQ